MYFKSMASSVAPEVGEGLIPNHQAMFEAPVPGTKAGDIIQSPRKGLCCTIACCVPRKLGLSSTPGS